MNAINNNFGVNDDDDPGDIRASVRKAVTAEKKKLQEARESMVKIQERGDKASEAIRIHAKTELAKLATRRWQSGRVGRSIYSVA